MDFTLNHGVIRSSNLEVEGNSTRINVEGEVDQVAKTVNLNLQAGLKGIVGSLTSVVGKILTVHGEGPIGSVDWSLAPLAVFNGTPLKDLGEGAGNLVDKTGDAVVDTGKAVGEGVKQTVDKTGEVVDEVGDALIDGVKGIFGKKKDEKKD